MAKARRPEVLDEPTQLILDRLGVTLQQLYDFGERGYTPGASTVADIPIRLQRPGTSLKSGFWRINLGTLHGLLGADLDSRGIGYAYKIARNGALVHGKSGGWAQLPGDDQSAAGFGAGSVRWGLHIPMAIASVTKLITAMALAPLLRMTGLNFGSSIGSALPAYWNAPAASRSLTFHQLLRHETGLGSTFAGSHNPGKSDFVSAREEIQAGPQPAGLGPWPPNYKNINYTILRVMFATLTGAIPPLRADTLWDFVSAGAYAKFVNDNVFAAAGIDPRGFVPQENAAMAYASPPAVPGAQLRDDTANAGQRGWHLSIQELMLVLAEFRRGNSIVSPRRAEEMLRNGYGVDGALQTRAGPVYTKNGRTPFGLSGMDSAVYLMPGGVELAIFVNSLPKPSALATASGASSSLSGASSGTAVARPTHLSAVPQFILDSVELGF